MAPYKGGLLHNRIILTVKPVLYAMDTVVNNIANIGDTYNVKRVTTIDIGDVL